LSRTQLLPPRPGGARARAAASVTRFVGVLVACGLPGKALFPIKYIDAGAINSHGLLPLEAAMFVSGFTAPDGRSITIRFGAGAPAGDVTLSSRDVQPLVALLLALGGEAATRSGGAVAPAPDYVRPLPTDSMSLVSSSDGLQVLVVESGAAALGFSLAQNQLRQLGRSLLLVGGAGAGSMN
jgi:hypothetical protein